MARLKLNRHRALAHRLGRRRALRSSTFDLLGQLGPLCRWTRSVTGSARVVEPKAGGRTQSQPEINISSSHIVALREAQSLIGYQLRFNGGGPGQTKYFSARQCGSAEKARRAAQAYARSLGLPKARPRGGSVTGRVFSTSTTGAAGLRFEWTPKRQLPVLRVVATWVDKRGRSRHTSFSVQSNGLEGALDLAIAARTSAGAAVPEKKPLLRQLRKMQRSTT